MQNRDSHSSEPGLFEAAANYPLGTGSDAAKTTLDGDPDIDSRSLGDLLAIARYLFRRFLDNFGAWLFARLRAALRFSLPLLHRALHWVSRWAKRHGREAGLITAALGLVLFAAAGPQYSPGKLAPGTGEMEDSGIDTFAFAETRIDTPVAMAYETSTITVGRGDTLMDLLVKAGAGRGEAHEAITSIGKVFRPQRLRRGQEITLTFQASPSPATKERSGDLREVAIDVEPGVRVVASRQPAGAFSAVEQVAELRPALARKGGVISDSLFLSARRAGVPVGVLVDTIRVFSFDVDFQREIWRGDQFEILFEEMKDSEGAKVKDGNLLYAALTLRGKKMELYRHTPSDNGRTDYFDAKGQTARKALMRTPIDGARLTSRYGRRKHPILGYARMHRGLDFGANRGTPIMAAGDGIIEYLGRNGSYGKYIRIRHNGTYKTAYAHMKGYASKLRKGRRVKQGQIIGYVGTTGSSTGPHLHYEVFMNGKQVNPLKLKLPTGRKLKGKVLKNFQTEITSLNETMAALPLETRLASAE